MKEKNELNYVFTITFRGIQYDCVSDITIQKQMI